MAKKEVAHPKNEQELDAKIQALAKRRLKREAKEAKLDYGIDLSIAFGTLAYGLFLVSHRAIVDVIGEEAVYQIELGLRAAAFSIVLLIVSRSLRRIIAYRAGIRLK